MPEKDKAEILEKCAGKMSDTSLQRGESNIDFEYKAAAADEFVDAVEFVPQKNLVELPVNLHSKEGNNGAKVNFLGLGSDFRVDSKEKNVELLNLSVRNSGFPVDELMASSEPIHYEGLTSERYIDVESKSILGSNKRLVETGGFEAGISERGQTCEHTLIAFALGVKEIICCSNKRDATTPKYLKARGIDGAHGGLGKMFYCLGGQLPNRILIVDFSKTKAPKVAEIFEEMMNNSRY